MWLGNLWTQRFRIVKSIASGQLTGATASVFAIDGSGQIEVLGFNATGKASGGWTATNSGVVGTGL